MQNVKSKLGRFNFNVVYQPGTTTTADYGSRHLPPARLYSARERSELGIEEEQEDVEIIANRGEEVIDAVTISIYRQNVFEGKTFVLLLEDIKRGQLRVELVQSACKECSPNLVPNLG